MKFQEDSFRRRDFRQIIQIMNGHCYDIYRERRERERERNN